MLKELLRLVFGKSIVNYEELLTIVCHCESIIYFRPLTYIHEDPNELLPLYPAMFIHGNSKCETPDLNEVDRSSLIKRTKYLQKLLEDLRQRSRKDSLPVEKTPESSTYHVSDSPTDYVPDSPVESTDNYKEKPPTKTRLGRTIKIPRKLDL
ncbi:DUF5641 domain-containing protein [Trichonephila clavipes]|uniref:DUF5641 domain-containing protein n=1 Tax=Trichonephila clavipes TaxID=2585209 RepID=A0A8X6S6Y9_TRICX|nr:DUF5641 domain-containing protein [Trichonephila clavipes]